MIHLFLRYIGVDFSKASSRTIVEFAPNAESERARFSRFVGCGCVVFCFRWVVMHAPVFLCWSSTAEVLVTSRRHGQAGRQTANCSSSESTHVRENDVWRFHVGHMATNIMCS